MHKMQILGTGCTKCHKLSDAAELAAKTLSIPYELEKVTDFLRFADFGVMITPALVLDGKVLVAGKVPSAPELEALMKSAVGEG